MSNFNFQLSCFAALALFLVVIVQFEDQRLRTLRLVPVRTEFKKSVFHPQNGSPSEHKDDGPGNDTIFLIGIFSTIKSTEDKKRRQQIRETYVGFLGHTIADMRVCSLQQYIYWKNENSLDASVCRVLYTFVIGANESEDTDHFRTDRPILAAGNRRMFSFLFAKENEVDCTDCTYLNVKENMNKGKSNAWWKFSSQVAELYGIDYVAKVDSDTMLSMSHFMDFIITDLPPYPYNVRTYGGNMAYNANRMQHGHLYASGQFSFFSRDMAAFVSDDSLDRIAIKESKIGFQDSEDLVMAEDIDTGILAWMHPYPLKIIFMNLRVPWIHHIKTEADWKLIWEETKGILPLSRVIGNLDHMVEPGEIIEYDARNGK